MSESIVALELAEIEAIADLYRAAGPDVVANCGLSVKEVGDAVLIAVTRFDVLALNRLVGLGLRSSPPDAALAAAISAIEQTGSPRCFVPVAPTGASDDLGARLERLGLRQYNNWMRLRRSLDDLPRPSDSAATSLDVRRIGSAHADVFGSLVAEAFDYPSALAPITSQTIGRPNWHHYLAFEDDTPIASAAMYVAGSAAWFGFAATDAAHRKRGAQQALIARRLRDAADAGCTWVSVETAEDTVMRDAPSFRNLRRLGFEVAYKRPNYLWVKRAPAP
jgi:ribosomal protein S18 acetylase RimI-like enzyme